jgi:hypothetical protein
MKTLRVLIVGLLLAAMTVGCIPAKMLGPCQDRVSACLKECPPRGVAGASSTQGPAIGADSRTPCEQNCHETCR